MHIVSKIESDMNLLLKLDWRNYTGLLNDCARRCSGECHVQDKAQWEC